MEHPSGHRVPGVGFHEFPHLDPIELLSSGNALMVQRKHLRAQFCHSLLHFVPEVANRDGFSKEFVHDDFLGTDEEDFFSSRFEFLPEFPNFWLHAEFGKTGQCLSQIVGSGGV